jgi:hypothetical protein
VESLSKAKAYELLDQIGYFSKANNPYRKFKSWRLGMTPTQLVRFGNAGSINLREVALARDPRTGTIDFFDCLTK